MQAGATTKVAKTVCGLCANACGLDAHVERGKIMRVEAMPEHPMRWPCIKSQAIIDWVYNGDRATEPMRRIEGQWQEISWGEALKFIAHKLKIIKENEDARSLAVHLGFPLIGSPAFKLANRFCDAYGSPNFTSGNSICGWARGMGQSITFDHRTTLLAPALRSTRCIIIWGMNPIGSSAVLATAVTRIRKQGAKLIVIDPRVTPLARQADIHAQIRPGTDAALALAIMNVIIAEQLFDKEFVDEWAHGFDALSVHVKEYTPERIADITWLTTETIRDIARVYSAAKPACIVPGMSLDHCTNGVQTSRALSCLAAITGNFDVPGGSTFGVSLEQSDLRLTHEVTGEVGADYPLFTRFLHESSSASITNAILNGRPYPIKALIVSGCNAALTWPDTTKVMRAFEQLQLLVVMDMFMTDTAKAADVFLPAASFVESTTLRDYALAGLNMAMLTQQAIKPLGKSWPDWRFWVELGKEMGYARHFPWKTEDELHATLLSSTGVSLEELKQRPGGVFYRGREERRYLADGFHTPSAKAELYSAMMEEYGYDPLPTYHEPAESPISKPHLVKEYPFVLITGPRVQVYTHSQLRNVEAMRRHHPEPLVQMHPDAAKGLGIDQGDIAKVETGRGSVTMRTHLTRDILPQVVSIPHGWAGDSNANLLTSDEEIDPISGYPAFKSMLCRVSKA